ncbi:MAG: hypothetical protein II986_09120 [Alistipes sp.]|nr:hypothetical protein [Alistipes sp.]
MKKFILLWTAVLLFTACSYQDGHTVELTHSDNITIEKALLYYNKHYANSYTRSNIDERLPFVIGDAEWLWEEAQTSSYNNKSAVDIPITGGYKYRAYRKQPDGTYRGVDTSSKIVVAQDDTTGNISFYIRVSIPDTEEQNTSIESLNYEDRTNFSGLEYYITIDGCPVAIVKFENGKEVDGVFLGDTTIDGQTKIKKLSELLNGLCIGRRDSNTRSDGEFDYGKVGEVFINQFGSYCVYVDTNNDGIADAVTQIFPDDIAYTFYFGGSSNGGSTGSNSGNTGSSGSTTGSSTAGSGGLSSGGSGAAGFGGGSGSGSNQGSSTNNNPTGNLLDNTLTLVNPLKTDFVLNPLEGIIILPSEPLSPSRIKALILAKLSNTHPVRDFINSSMIPIYSSSVIPKERIRTLAADYKGWAIYYNSDYYNRLSNAGRLLAIFHEYMHLYLSSKDHGVMIGSLEYQQGLRDLFPNMSAFFYEYIQYIGCKDVFSDINNTFNENSKIYRDIRNNMYHNIYR